MRRLLLFTALAALAAGKPGTYRETEDFQYSRSSSDEGHKAGYYGAQRGNTGGNYEKAHNMDSLAQNQMSSAVDHVQGEIGDTSSAPAGSVFTAANTKGIYGQGGHYNLANLHGRNFQEGVTVDDSLSHASLSSLNSGYGSQASLHNAGHTGGYSSFNTKKSGYSGVRTSGQYQIADQRATAANDHAYANLFEGQTDQVLAANQQAAYGAYNRYDQSQSSQRAAQSSYGSNSHTRLVGAGSAPVRVVIRPGTNVNVPVAAEAYDARQTASAFDYNSINSEAEDLTNTNTQQIAASKPNSHGKSYESAYSYKKKWEKHETVPAAVPLAILPANPYPINSQLYQDYEASRFQGSAATSQNQLSQNYLGYNTAATNSQYQSGYNDLQTKSLASSANKNAYNSAFKNVDSSADLASLVSGTNADGTPKKYESAYSYHKSWERQGDPYVIKPASGSVYDAQAAQRLTSHSAYHANKHASHSGYSQSALDEECDCDEQGHVRVARSYGSEVAPQQQQQHFQNEDLGQQIQQNQFENLEDLTQQSQQNQFENLEDLGQQTQNKWDLEDLTQQTQRHQLENFELAGQSQNQFKKLEDLGQQTQQKQFDKLENLGQQTQTKWDLENLDQQTQNFDNYYQTRHGPQRQGNSDKLIPTQQHDQASMHSLYQGSQNSQGETIHEDSFKLQGTNEKPIEIEQSVGQESQLDKTKDLGQHNNMQNGWDKLEILNQHKPMDPQQVSNVKPVWEQSEDDTQQHSVWQNQNKDFDQQSRTTGNDWTGFTNPQTSQVWQMSSSSLHNNHNSNSNSRDSSSLQGLWDKIDNMAQQSTASMNSKENQNNKFARGYGYNGYNSQHTYQTWEQDNSESAKSLLHQNTFGSSYSGSNPWQFNREGTGKHQETQNNEDLHTTEKSLPNSGSTYAGRRPWQWTPVITETQTTIKPKDLIKPNYGDRGDIGGDDKTDDDVKPIYPGRGNIGADVNGMTTEKSRTTIFYLPGNSNLSNKPFKTPEEIEALSLTKETENKNNQDAIARTNLDASSQSDASLSVMSINDQWLHEQKKHDSSNFHYITSLTTSTPKNMFIQNVFHQSQTTSQQRATVENSNQGSQRDKMDQSHKIIEKQNTDQQFVIDLNSQHNTGNHYEQGHSGFVQHSQTAVGGDLEDLGQQVQTSWNLEQQSDLTQQTEDLGQEVQKNENLDQFDLTQHSNNFDTFGQPKVQMDNFYEQKYHSANYQSPQNVESPKKSDAEIVVPAIVEEVTTPKPGFWKSVGNKFVNAKDKVSSWFSSSS